MNDALREANRLALLVLQGQERNARLMRLLCIVATCLTLATVLLAVAVLMRSPPVR